MNDQLTPTRSPSLWYTTKEAAEIAKVSLKQIQRWMASGDLPYCQISPRRRLILHEDLEAFVRSRRVYANDT